MIIFISYSINTMKYKHFKKRFIIILIIGSSISGYFFFSLTSLHQSFATYTIVGDITPSYSSGTFFITWNWQTNNNIIIFSGKLQDINNDHEELFSSTFSLVYNIEKASISSLIIHDIIGQSSLSYANNVFIDEVIKPSLWQELISWDSYTTKFQQLPSLWTTQYQWALQQKDPLWNTQQLQIFITKKCNIRSIVSSTPTCHLNGNFSLGTPLSSGPISWKIQALITASSLQ